MSSPFVSDATCLCSHLLYCTPVDILFLSQNNSLMLCADTPLLGDTETTSAAGTNGQHCFQSFS